MKSAESLKSSYSGATTVRDVAGLSGVALVSYGAWLAWPPAGFMLAGTLLLVGAILAALAGRSG